MGQMVGIEVDSEVFQCLQQRAEPLKDTPNSVLRRVFGLKEASPPAPPIPREELSPARQAIIAALEKHPNASAAELAKMIGFSAETCTKSLRGFYRDGWVIRIRVPSTQGIAYRWRLATEEERSQFTPRPAVRDIKPREAVRDIKPRKRFGKDLSPAGLAIIAALKEHPNATTREVAQAAGIAYATCTATFRELYAVGIAIRTIVPLSHGSEYRWRLATEEERSQFTPVSRSHKELSRARVALIAALKEHPDVTADVLAQAAGIGLSTCGNLLREFHQKRTVVRIFKPNTRGVGYLWRLATEEDRAGNTSADSTGDSAESSDRTPES